MRQFSATLNPNSCGCVGAYDTVNYQILDELKMGFKQFHENMTDQGQ